MITDVVPSLKKDRSISSVVADIKSLFKGLVLIANVLPVFVGYWLALHFTNASFIDHLDVFFLTMIGSTVLMAGALVLNNWYDVDIDTVMIRTQQRPTVTGKISLKTVLVLGIALSIIGFVFLLFTTIEAAIYGFIGWFTYVILYTMWSKRRYTLNTVIGSVSGAVTPLIGWAAIAPAMHIVPIVLFIILFIWQIPHTFAIAMKKSEEYRIADVAMLPVVYGFDMTKRQMAVYIICLLPWPFYLSSLGITFVIVATVLNIGWFIVSVSSSYIKDDYKWAQINFLYSVNYLAILFIMMFIATLPFFN
ncbi:heme o synthase [Sporosarcina sp. FA9]|uniref:heme o synthase n=1 Tax=Sporosarcina sp. FA9 TaxID=3413030 RepID=UPI003F65C3A0